MADGKFYVDNAVNLLADTPRLSHALESFRAYSWEIQIPQFAGVLSQVPGLENNDRLTLACKKITQPGFTVEDIEVHRVNEKFYYPGKPTPDNITVTFDNLIKGDVADALFAWMRSVYDPVYGIHYAGLGNGTSDVNQSPEGLAGMTQAPIFKRTVTIWQLDAHRNPVTHVNLYGCYPKGWKLGEFNYETNDFHTIEMDLRYDFAVQFTETSDIDPVMSPIAVS
tara:strand:+ start:442 stop:1113 length:672 start_codon:yes stop_codon:yes gene_type:complete